MAIYYPDILERKAEGSFTYAEKDVMLYALGIGLGRDPLNEAELQFVLEKQLEVAPTAATVLMAAGLGFRRSPPPRRRRVTGPAH